MFQNCATNIKPIILGIYELQLLPLRRQLTPCLSGLVLGLLPGLDDTAAELYKPVLALLDRFCSATSLPAFYGAMWKSLLISAHVRVAAINFLLARLPRDNSPARLAPYLPQCNTLVLNALGKALADPNGLVQRQALELLNSHFPLRNGPFDARARTLLVGLALPVLRRREVSLTRRLSSWLLGGAPDDLDYFVRFGRQAVVDAVRAAFAVDPTRFALANTTAGDAAAKQMTDAACQPLRILMFLLDTPEIGDVVIDELMVDALLYLNRYKEGHAFSHDIMRSMNLLIDQLQPEMLWQFACKLFATSGTASVRAVTLVDSLLDILPSAALFAPTTLATNLPTLLCSVIRALHQFVDDSEHLAAALALTLKVVGKLYSLRQQQNAQPPPAADIQSPEDAAAAVAEANVRAANLKAQREQLLVAIGDFHEFALHLMHKHPQLQSDARAVSPSLLHAFEMTCQLLTTLDTALPTSRPSSAALSAAATTTTTTRDLPPWFCAVAQVACYDEPRIACIAARTTVSLLTVGSEESAATESAAISLTTRRAAIDDAALLPRIVQRLWQLLEPAHVAVHYTAAETLMRLSALPRDHVTPVVAGALAHRDGREREVGHQRFALLWRLSGELGGGERFSAANLFAMLDSLNDEQPSVRLTGQSWLADSISRAERVLDPLIVVLLAPETARHAHTYRQEFDTARVLDVFRKLTLIVECDFQLFMRQVLSKAVNADLVRRFGALEHANQQPLANASDDNAVDGDGGGGGVEVDAAAAAGSEADLLGVRGACRSYLDLLCAGAMLYVQGQTDARHSPQFRDRNSIVQTAAAEFLQYLLTKITSPERARVVAHNVRIGVLRTLSQAVVAQSLVLQVYLLGVLRAVVQLSGGGAGAGDDSSAVLLQTLIMGLMQPPAKNIRYHWLEFVTASLPHMGDELGDVVVPALRCMCELLDSYQSAYDSLSSRDILMLLHALAVILDHCLFDADAPITPAQSRPEATLPVRVLGNFVKDVFSSQGGGSGGGGGAATSAGDGALLSGSAAARERTKKAVTGELGVVLSSLVAVWQKGAVANGSEAVVLTPDEVHNKYAIQDQIVGILDPLATRYAGDLVARMLDQWHVAPSAAAGRADPPAVVTTLDLLNQLTARANVLNAALAFTKQASMREIRESLSAIDDALAAASVDEAQQQSGSVENIAASHASGGSIASVAAPAVVGVVGDDNADAAEPAASAAAVASPPPSQSPPLTAAAAVPADASVHEPLTRQLVAVDFVSCFVQRCVSLDTLCEAWPALNDALKIALAHAHISVYPFVLRVLHFFVRRVSLERFGEVRGRIRRDLQQLFQRVVERCFLLAGRETAPATVPTERDRRLSVALTTGSPRISSTSSLAARRAKRSSMPVMPTPAQASTLAAIGSGGDERVRLDATSRLRRFARDEALEALAEMLAPTLDNVFDDNKNKAAGLLAQHVVQIVPHLRGNARRSGVAALASVSLLASFTEFGYMLRAYRNEALDVFYQSDFFRLTREQLPLWVRIVNHVMALDTNALNEFLKLAARSLTASQPMGASSLLTSAVARNRDLDIARARFVKRLAFIVYAGAQDQCVHILPQIQERLVEALRIGFSPRLHHDVLLCFRAMLLRFSASKLASFWPVILTELVRIFSLETPDPNLLLAAVKFLDLALVMPSDTFGHFEWVFLADRIETALGGGSAGGGGDDNDEHAAGDEAGAPLNFARSDDNMFAPLLNQLCNSDAVVVDANANFAALWSEPSPDNLQRPIIVARSLNEFAESGGYSALLAYLDKFRHEASEHRALGLAADNAYIDSLMYADFCEGSKQN